MSAVSSEECLIEVYNPGFMYAYKTMMMSMYEMMFIKSVKKELNKASGKTELQDDIYIMEMLQRMVEQSKVLIQHAYNSAIVQARIEDPAFTVPETASD